MFGPVGTHLSWWQPSLREVTCTANKRQKGSNPISPSQWNPISFLTRPMNYSSKVSLGIGIKMGILWQETIKNITVISQCFTYSGHPGHASNQQNLPNIRLANFSIWERFLTWSYCLFNQFTNQAFKLRASKLQMKTTYWIKQTSVLLHDKAIISAYFRSGVINVPI